MPVIFGQGNNTFTLMNRDMNIIKWFRVALFSLEYVTVEESERSEGVSLEGELEIF